LVGRAELQGMVTSESSGRQRKILLKGGRVIDPASGTDRLADVLIEGQVVRAIDRNLAAHADLVVDCRDKVVAPGLVDIHVHFREPGNEDEETIATGSAAAAAGGFTSVACMPNTTPPLDNEAAVEFVLRQAARAGFCRVWPIGSITKGRKGQELAEMGQMVRAGAVAFSDDGCSVASAAVLLKAMQYVRMFDKPIIEHCEDPELSAGAAMNGGAVSVRLGLPGSPPIAEQLIVQRDITLAEYTGCRLHIAHISTAGAVQTVREAKRRGCRVTTEVCPHHLLLTDEACSGFDPNFKVNPPLRSDRDVQACLEAVVDGTIDCLVTDHAPHGKEEKELEFLYAPPGMIGLESALAMFVRALVEPGLLDWPQLLRLMTVGPAEVLNLPVGRLAVGQPADVVVIDPALRWRIDVRAFRSRSRNCPFDGWDAVGRAVLTICDGSITHADATTGLEPDRPIPR